MFSGTSRSATATARHEYLARISHRLSTAAADPGMSAALRSIGFLDVLLSTPAESSRRTLCIHARLRRLVTKPCEKCGLAAAPQVVEKQIRIKDHSISGQRYGPAGHRPNSIGWNADRQVYHQARLGKT